MRQLQQSAIFGGLLKKRRASVTHSEWPPPDRAARPWWRDRFKNQPHGDGHQKRQSDGTEGNDGRPSGQQAISREIKNPKTTPMVPPAKEIMVASTTNWRTMSDWRAPTARRRPISRGALQDAGQHDVHDADAATSSEIDAMATITVLKKMFCSLLLGQQLGGDNNAEVVRAVMR